MSKSGVDVVEEKIGLMLHRRSPMRSKAAASVQ